MKRASPAALLCWVACVTPTAAPPSRAGDAKPPPADIDDVAHLRVEAENLLSSRAESLWRRWTSGEILAGVAVQADLASAASLAKVDRARLQAKDPLEQRRLLRLRTFLADESISEADAALSSEIADVVSGATMGLENREVAFRDLDSALETEPDAEVRRKIWAATQTVLDRLNPLLTQRDALREKTARTLGYARMLDFTAELREVSLDSLSVLADEFLAATADLNREAIEGLAQTTLGTSLAKVGPADLPRLFRADPLEAAFPAAHSAVLFRTTARNLGMDLGGLTLDLEERRGKVPAPLCLPIHPPGDVRCSLPPRSGIGGIAALLREGAQGWRMTSNRSTKFELKWLGGTAAALAYSQLFERLTEDPGFLSETGVPASMAAAFARTRSARRLFLARRAAGRFLIEKARLGGLASDPAEAFRETMERADGVALSAIDGQRFLLETTDLLASADDFRAALLAAQLEASLSSRFGATWWRTAVAGAFLRSLWVEGTRATPDEVARSLGAPAVEMEAFVGAAKRSRPPRADAGVPASP